MKKLIDEYKKTKLYKRFMFREFRYQIEAEEGEFDNYQVEHLLEQTQISDSEAIAIARDLVDKHLEYRRSPGIPSEDFMLDVKSTEQPFEQWESDKAFDGGGDYDEEDW